MISSIIYIIFKIIFLIILVGVLISWVPVIDTRKGLGATFIRLYEIIMGPFKAIIPPIGMIDISPLVACILLSILAKLLISILMRFGL